MKEQLRNRIKQLSKFDRGNAGELGFAVLLLVAISMNWWIVPAAGIIWYLCKYPPKIKIQVGEKKEEEVKEDV